MLTCSYASEPCRAFMQRFNGWELWLGVSLLRDQLLAAFAANAAGATLGEQLAALFSHPDEGVGSSAASIVPGSGQLWLCGVLLSVIAVGNLHTTTVTLVNNASSALKPSRSTRAIDSSSACRNSASSAGRGETHARLSGSITGNLSPVTARGSG
eukprot:PRCOL_00006837-RA